MFDGYDGSECGFNYPSIRIQPTIDAIGSLAGDINQQLVELPVPPDLAISKDSIFGDTALVQTRLTKLMQSNYDYQLFRV